MALSICLTMYRRNKYFIYDNYSPVKITPVLQYFGANTNNKIFQYCRCTIDVLKAMTFNNTEFTGYLIIADDMVILPERIKYADKSSIWVSDEINIASLKTGKLVLFSVRSSFLVRDPSASIF